jgi:hypothetical protein
MRLIVQTGIDAGRKFRLTKSVITIGRDPSNDIVLGDTRVSRRHAEIRRWGSEFIIADLGSANGTYVNEKLIRAPQVLRQGDSVRVGNTVLSCQVAPSVGPGGEAAWAPTVRREASSLPALLAGSAIVLIAVFALLAVQPGGCQPIPTPTPLAPNISVTAVLPQGPLDFGQVFNLRVIIRNAGSGLAQNVRVYLRVNPPGYFDALWCNYPMTPLAPAGLRIPIGSLSPGDRADITLRCITPTQEQIGDKYGMNFEFVFTYDCYGVVESPGDRIIATVGLGVLLFRH